jgi:hypothetical protein
VPTITLSGSGSGDNTGSIAFHPGFNQYYGAHAGNSSFSGHVWDINGNPLQSTVVGTDVRSLNYNPNTGNIEIVSFDAVDCCGLSTLGLDGSGHMTGSNPVISGALPGLNGTQSMPAYDPLTNHLYSRNVGGTINVVDRNSGLLVNTINLNLAAAGNPNLQLQTLGFDSFFDVFVTIDLTNTRALVHDINGNYLGASALPVGTPLAASFNMGYANGQLFVTADGGSFAYHGFRIFAPVPEPASALLMSVAGLGLVAKVRRRRLP